MEQKWNKVYSPPYEKDLGCGVEQPAAALDLRDLQDNRDIKHETNIAWQEGLSFTVKVLIYVLHHLLGR